MFSLTRSINRYQKTCFVFRTLATSLSGRPLAAQIRREVAAGILDGQVSRSPCLAIIRVGDNPASQVFVEKKLEACFEVGITGEDFCFPSNSSFETIQKQIWRLNQRQSVDGILLQLPLPPHLSATDLIEEIAPEKDVDGLHPTNLGHLVSNTGRYLQPCTPLGIMDLLRSIDPGNKDFLKGKDCLIIGSSVIVGKPLAIRLMQGNATVQVCHRFSKDVASKARQADIIIAAAGSPNLVKKNWIKPGAIVIDVGCNRLNGALCGDVDPEVLESDASYVTPVPGGVGPLTVANVVRNTFLAWKSSQSLQRPTQAYTGEEEV